MKKIIKDCAPLLIVVLSIVVIGLVLYYKPEFERECILFSKGVWSNTCLG